MTDSKELTDEQINFVCNFKEQTVMSDKNELTHEDVKEIIKRMGNELRDILNSFQDLSKNPQYIEHLKKEWSRNKTILNEDYNDSNYLIIRNVLDVLEDYSARIVPPLFFMDELYIDHRNWFTKWDPKENEENMEDGGEDNFESLFSPALRKLLHIGLTQKESVNRLQTAAQEYIKPMDGEWPEVIKIEVPSYNSYNEEDKND